MFFSQNSFSATTAGCCFNWLNTQRHTHFSNWSTSSPYSSTVLKTAVIAKRTSTKVLLYAFRLVFTTRFGINAMPMHSNVFNCRPRTCLTNHKRLILHHITPLVIYSLRGRDTHTHTHTARQKAISRSQTRANLQQAHAWLKNLNP